MSDVLKVKIEDAICIATISRPPMNTLNKEVMSALLELLEQVNANKEIRVLILTGEGEKAFAAGAEISEFLELDQVSGAALIHKGQRIFEGLESLSIPVICVLNGYALGAGLELALACDIRIAEQQVQLGLPEVGIGLIPGYGGTQRLSRLIGNGRAKELIYTGRYVHAEEAKSMGIVEKVVETGTALTSAIEMAKAIVQKAPLAITAAKRSINVGSDVPLRQGLDLEETLCSELFGTLDLQEGTRAFFERRKAVFIGS